MTGITLPELLRASHAKPWADCESDAERLNVFNGLLLVASLDALFDRFLIAFDDDGIMLISSQILDPLRVQLEISVPQKLRKISPEHLPFLRSHRYKFNYGARSDT